MAKILLVEDEEGFRGLLEDILAQDNHQVTSASHGGEAIDYAKCKSYDLILTDLIMPGKDGIETIMELRVMLPKAKIIAMSGGGFGVARNYLPLAQKIGAHYSLMKPFNLKSLRDAIEEALGASPMAPAL